jgi:uncharacterized ParB-like nuclease family protein
MGKKAKVAEKPAPEASYSKVVGFCRDWADMHGYKMKIAKCEFAQEWRCWDDDAGRYPVNHVTIQIKGLPDRYASGGIHRLEDNLSRLREMMPEFKQYRRPYRSTVSLVLTVKANKVELKAYKATLADE